MLLGIERASDSQVFDSGSLLQIFQAQRVGLAFAGVIPLTLGLSIAVVPLQLGARQIAYPRLALTGCYIWLGGLALTFAALGRNGGVGGGDPTAVDLFLAAHGLMVVGLAASAGSVATSVLTTRAPGMTMRRVPLFSWSALIGALGMLIALPGAARRRHLRLRRPPHRHPGQLRHRRDRRLDRLGVLRAGRDRVRASLLSASPPS